MNLILGVGLQTYGSILIVSRRICFETGEKAGGRKSGSEGKRARQTCFTCRNSNLIIYLARKLIDKCAVVCGLDSLTTESNQSFISVKTVAENNIRQKQV